MPILRRRALRFNNMNMSRKKVVLNLNPDSFWARLGILAAGAALFTAGLFLLSLFWRCPARALLGIPCPGCGMTTAFFCLWHLDLTGAWLYHPLVFLLLGCGAVWAVAYLRGQWRAVARPMWGVVLLIIFMAFWGWRLYRLAVWGEGAVGFNADAPFFPVIRGIIG